MKILTYVEIDVDYCSRTYGTAPCTASVGVTGDRKCFNTLKTCQDSVNFNNVPVTLRFTTDVSYLPKDIEAIPSLVNIAFTPGTVSLGESLGERSSLTVQFKDHRHSDTGEGFDKYLADRGYDPFSQGTFWGKFRARQPYLQGRSLRLIRGSDTQDIGDMDTRHFIIEAFDGPNPQGLYTIVAKDILKLADNDRAQAPSPLELELTADLTDTAQQIPLGTGEGALLSLLGYAAIGGNEIVLYHRDAGIDSYVKLLLHGDGSNGGTTFTDSSTSAHTVTRGGGTVTSTAQIKFGTASLLFDGTDDFLSLDGSSEFAFGTSDFTIDMWARPSNSGSELYLYDSRPNATNGVYVTIRRNSSNKIELFVNSSVRITSTTSVLSGTWYHIAVVRSSGVTTLYIDGIAEGGTYTDANSYLNGTSRPTIGTNGNSTSTSEWNGHMDEVRVSNGIARWTQDFVVPVAAYSSTFGDTLHAYRGQLGTTATTHKDGDRIQNVITYYGQKVSDIIYDLLTTYADIPASYINLDEWTTEVDAYINRVYTAYIAEPTGVNKLVGELCEQAGLAIWWDDTTQKIKLRVIRPVDTSSAGFNEDIILESSLDIVDQPEKRVSQIWTYFGQINPLEGQDDPNNYSAIAVTIDADTETAYGKPAIKKIYSRWIPDFGRTTALKLNDLIISRFKNAPRRASFALFHDQNVSLGSGYFLGSFAIQDDTGAATTAPIQVTRLSPEDGIIKVEAEEMLAAISVDDLNDRQIIIDSDAFNLNLLEIHDSLFPEITDPTGITVTVTIEAGVLIGSTSTSSPAIEVGSFPSALNLVLVVNGRIQGCGGMGGHGESGSSPGTWHDGLPGGTALYTRKSLTLTNNGEIWGGGGGGGAGYNNHPSVQSTYGGSGGAGSNPGAGGGRAGSYGVDGNPGTTEAGGVSAKPSPTGVQSGAGGGPGLAGVNGAGGPYSPTRTNVGGAAGNAIDGISYVTVSVAGDKRGGEVN